MALWWRFCTDGVFGQCRHLRPCGQRHTLRLLVAKNRTVATASGDTRQPRDTEPHVNVMQHLRSHVSERQSLSNIAIVDALRRCYPGHTVTQTPKSTGILKFAKAGQAHAVLDTSVDFYASRYYKLATDDPRGPGRLKDEVEFGRYSYRWKDFSFQVYVACFWESEYSQAQNHYIIYPRSPEDVEDGRSAVVDKLITAAAQHVSKIDEEIWVYDRGYWRKNSTLWKNVQSCKWDNVILNREMKLQLISDIEGFYDRKDDYNSFAVPWKVSHHSN